MAIVVRTKEELRLMREAGKITAEILALLASKVRPGITTLELDKIARLELRKWRAESSFLNYPSPNGGPLFPATICASLNDEVVHGIPDRRHVLREGDILSIDFGVKYKGYHGDSALTVPVGKVSPTARRLLDVTREALQRGIEAAVPGNRVGDISWAVQRYVESHGFSVVRQYVGHGIGREMHEDPQIPNWGEPHQGAKLRAGMALAIEPMVNSGGAGTRTLRDQWTVVTADHSLSAHFEHSIALTDNGPEILTLVD